MNSLLLVCSLVLTAPPLQAGAATSNITPGLGTQLVVDNICLMHRYWLKPDEEIGAQVKQNWDAIEKNCRAHPHAINWGPVRPSTPRMLGLHPDYPNPKISLKQLRDLDLK